MVSTRLPWTVAASVRQESVGLSSTKHRAGAAFAAVAAGLGAGEADLFAQVIEQQNIVGDRIGAVAPVQPA